MKGISISLFFCWFCFASYAQNDTLSLKQLSARTLKKLGAGALKQNDPNSAITFYRLALNKRNTDAEVLMGLGTAYMRVRDYKRAQHAFLKAYNFEKKDKKGKTTKTGALYYHALMQKSNNLYDSARQNFVLFKKQYKGGDKTIKKQAGKEIAFCDSLQRVAGNVKKVSVFRLDTSINKVNTESSPLMIDDYTLVYSSVRTEKQELVGDEDTGYVVKRKLYLANKKNGKWKFAGEYGDLLNEKGFNTGNASLSQDKKRLYFTRCRELTTGQMICAIYVSRYEDGKWQEPVKLPKQVNNSKYTSTMPAVYTEPVKGNDIIYFVSNRKKGRGGLDIWYTVYNKKNNTYREPKNAGTKINSSQNELTPFFDKETQALYFSSEGLGGFGGYDIFKASGDGKRWSQVENIGKPVNTGADELYYTISENRREGFFVSNRVGGNALKNATCCDDIYAYYDNEYKQVIVSGQITDGEDPFEPIVGVTVDVYLKPKGSEEKVFLKSVTTDSKGNYKVGLEPGQEYVFIAKKQDYLSTPTELLAQSPDGLLEINKDLKIIKKPRGTVSLPHLQYEFSSPKLMKGSDVLLDTTIYKLMALNPSVIIEIQSHTDSKGSAEFNQRLSQKRAESVVNYLVKKGIKIKRLRAAGYGESKPVAPNENPDGSDNPEGRAKNRRTDFKIIGELEQDLIEDE